MSAVSNSPIRFHPMQGGMTLIEVLVALLVLSIGLLGVAGLQWQALRSNHGAHLRSQATILAHDIADRMRANRTEAEDGAYAVDIGEIPTGETLADFDVVAWKEALADILPAGDGSVEMVPIDADRNVARIRIQWSDRLGDNQFFTETEL